MTSFSLALTISIVYFIIRFMEVRFISRDKEKEIKPLKELVKDTSIVYISVLVASFIINQLNENMGNIIGGSTNGGHPPIFTDNPEF